MVLSPLGGGWRTVPMLAHYYPQNMLRDHTIPICPLPGLGYCVPGRGNFGDEANEKCTADCYATCDPVGAGPPRDPDGPCLISFYEDYDRLNHLLGLMVNERS